MNNKFNVPVIIPIGNNIYVAYQVSGTQNRGCQQLWRYTLRKVCRRYAKPCQFVRLLRRNGRVRREGVPEQRLEEHEHLETGKRKR